MRLNPRLSHVLCYKLWFFTNVKTCSRWIYIFEPRCECVVTCYPGNKMFYKKYHFTMNSSEHFCRLSRFVNLAVVFQIASDSLSRLHRYQRLYSLLSALQLDV